MPPLSKTKFLLLTSFCVCAFLVFLFPAESTESSVEASQNFANQANLIYVPIIVDAISDNPTEPVNPYPGPGETATPVSPYPGPGETPTPTAEPFEPTPTPSGPSGYPSPTPTPSPVCSGFPMNVATTAELNNAIGCFNQADAGEYEVNILENIDISTPIWAIDNPNSAMIKLEGNGYYIDGNQNLYTIFYVENGNAWIKDLYIKNGHVRRYGTSTFCKVGTFPAPCGSALTVGSSANVTVTQSTIVSSGGVDTGAVLNYGKLSLIQSNISRNSVGGFAAIDNRGELLVQQSSIVRNTGAGIQNSGIVEVVNSTISQNNSYKAGFINYSGGNAVIKNSTIYQNLGGGIQNSGDMDVFNSIVADNDTDALDCDNDGTLNIDNSNLQTDGSCDQAVVSANINLGALQNNGGNTLTHALLSGSSAIDNGDSGICSDGLINGLDQREFSRTEDAQCDIGAFEKSPDDAFCSSFPVSVSTEDELVKAIDCFNGSGDGTFVINISDDIVLTFDTPTISNESQSELVINGNSESIDGFGLWKIFKINNGSVTINDLHITDGGTPRLEIYCDSFYPHFPNCLNGGAISVSPLGKLTFTNVLIDESSAWNGGGGIYNQGEIVLQKSVLATNYPDGIINGGIIQIIETSVENHRERGIGNSGVMNIEKSTIHNNGWAASYGGGGISNFGVMTVNNSTISQNSGNWSSGAITNSGVFTLTSSTVVSNTKPYLQVPGGENPGSGITNYGDGKFTIQNSLIAQNYPHDNCYNGSNGVFYVDDSSLIDDATCGNTIQASNINIGPLQDNGGPTLTHALGAGSVAIDAADADPDVTTDQRGVARPQGGAPDVGAYESEEIVSCTPLSPTTPPSTTIYAADTYDDAVGNGWGTADIGGSYTYLWRSDAADFFSVDCESGAITLDQSSASVEANLTDVDVEDSITSFSFSIDQLPSTRIFLRSQARRQANGATYRAAYQINSTGEIYLFVDRIASGWARVSSTESSGLTINPNTQYEVKTETSGSNPTTIKLKIWESGQPEPADWQHVATDSDPVLQSSGAAGLRANILSLGDNGPVKVSVDNLYVSDLPDVEPPTSDLFVEDSFDRTSAQGWGTADQGGTYTHLWGSAAQNDFSVDGSRGLLTLAAGAGREAILSDVEVVDSTSEITLQIDELPAGDSFVRLLSRHINNVTAYRGALQIKSNGDLRLFFDKLDGGSWGRVSTSEAVDLTIEAGTDYRIKMETSGTNPTTLKLKVWAVGSTEPADWQLTATDSTDSLQAAGGVGLRVNISSLAGSSQTLLRFEDYRVGGLGDVEPPPPSDTVVAQDNFDRTEATGWSSADIGGSYSYLWGATAINDFSVNGSEGVFTLNSSTPGREVHLDGVSVLDSQSKVVLSLSDIPSSTSYVRLYSRRVNQTSGYRGVVQISSTGSLSLWVDRLDNGSWGRVSTAESVNMLLAPDNKYNVVMETVGTSPTTIRLKVWHVDDPEPAEWMHETTDSTERLQAAGAVGFRINKSGAMTNGPIEFRFDDWVVTDLSP